MLKKKSNIILIPIMVFVVIFGIVIKFNYSKEGRFNCKKVVAKMLTSDSLLYAPLEFDGNIYFRSGFKFPEGQNTESIGQVEPKEMSFIVYLIMDNRIVCDKSDTTNTYIKTTGDDCRGYSKAELLENTKLVKETLGKYSTFALCNGENEEIRNKIDKNTVVMLEEKFGEVKYNKDDFNKVDKIDYIYVDDFTITKEHAIFIGCILTYKGKIYYGNLNNPIDGQLQENLNSILK